MLASERRAQVVDALRQIAGHDRAFAIFSDAAQPENYVQITGDGILEVTSRQYDGALPPLDAYQTQALADQGFSTSPDPNYRKDVDIMAASNEIVTLCERAFEVLGCSSLFELDVQIELE